MASYAPLAIYIHWPYCNRICPYCDFNVYKSRGQNNTSLLQAIIKDLEHWRGLSGNRHVTSIHFGGGTPSLLSSEDITILIQKIKALWAVRSNIEIALEANPIDADVTKWNEYHTAGVNRLSLGVQTFQPQALKILGRDHDDKQAHSALILAHEIFDSVSADIIFGWLGQTQAELENDIKVILASDIQHISTYQLTIENGTAFARAEERGQKRAVNEDKSADFFDFIAQTLRNEGYSHYEVSNFAKPDHSSQHNLAYWRGHDYVGVGPGAHGRLTINGKKYAIINELTPTAYIEQIQKTGSGCKTPELLTTSAWSEEYVLMGLRINEGISLDRYKDISGYELSKQRYFPLIEEGLLLQKGRTLIATHQGRLVLNAITESLLV